MEHEHRTSAMELTQPLRILINAALAHARVMREFKGIEVCSLRTLRTHPADEYSTSSKPIAAGLQPLPWREWLWVNLHLNSLGPLRPLSLRVPHLSHR